MVIISEISVGISDIAFASTSYALDLAELAARQDIDVNKFYVGIGQRVMSMPAKDEDIVTMAATAAKKIVDRNGAENISTILFATESGIDQSKAAGVYVHKLLNLQSNIRVVELKQACYSATAGIQMALGMVARDPKKQVLVIASDIARYEQDSAGEPTQGAGAIALLISANPKLVALEPASGIFTDEIMDFWRPNYSSTAFVDGKFSIRAYLRAVEESYNDFRANGGEELSDIDYVCYHQPFTKMAIKAHQHLHKIALSETTHEDQLSEIEPTLIYNREIGNSYTASMYFGLISLLDWSVNHGTDITGKRIGFLSYGSGSVAEFFTGTIVSGYQNHLTADANRQELDARTHIDWDTYNELYNFALPTDGATVTIDEQSTGPFRLARITDHQRIYQ